MSGFSSMALKHHRPRPILQEMRFRAGLVCASSALFLATAAAPAVATPTITEYTAGLSSSSGPLGITSGPGGSLWFAERNDDGGIGRITTAGAVTEFHAGLGADAEPTGIAQGPDGNLWFTDNQGRIGHVTPSGTITNFTVGITGGEPYGITAGPDGKLWFTERADPTKIGRITTAGLINEFSSGLTPGSRPWRITAGPDGNLWFTEREAPGRIGRITPAGVITEFTTGLTPNSSPTDIVAGPDGNVWFTERDAGGAIGRITHGGTITEFRTGLTTGKEPRGISVGNDGALWFTLSKSPGRVGRITTTGLISEYTTGLTASRPWYITPGADGNLWFTEFSSPARIGQITVAPGLAAAGASGLAAQSVRLNASVRPNTQATSYHFEYGLDANYGAQTPDVATDTVAGPVAASQLVGGLLPQTTYHFRAVATNASGTTTGEDQAFTTPAAPPAPANPAQTPKAAIKVPGPDVLSYAPPVIGRQVLVSPVKGSVKVRIPGSSRFVDFNLRASVPVGSVLDATSGVIRLTSAVDTDGATQTGVFWGAGFKIAQHKTGVTDLLLRGSVRKACRLPGNHLFGHGSRAASAAAASTPVRKLWGRDRHSRFRTVGRGSVATVRGTKWLTADYCDGTVTTVLKGKVLVHDKRAGRSVLVKAGQSHFARLKG